MERKYFVVKPNDSMPPKLPENLTYEIDIDDINALALFATTLEPVPALTESLGYISALFLYFQKKDHPLKNIYSQITSNQYGTHFLCTTIELCLIEKELRTNGITNKLLKEYSSVISDYQHLLKYNIEQHNNEQIKRNI